MVRRQKFVWGGIGLALTMMLVIAFAGPTFAGDTSCKTKYPIIMAHGMGFVPTATYPNSFPGIVEALRARGATVFTPTVEPLGPTREKAEEFKTEFLKIKAVSGAPKYNILCHSHGALYTRDAISNLGLGPYVASWTSAAGVNHGTVIAQMMTTLSEVAPGLADMIGGLLPVSGDPAKLAVNIEQLTPDYVINTFNPNTPNVKGIYYQSWCGQYRYYNLLKTSVDFTKMIIDELNGDTGTLSPDEAIVALYKVLPDTATEIYYLGGGGNDGLVPVESAKWGTYLGTQTGPWWSAGVNHLDEVNLAPNGTSFDAVGYWVKLVQNLKAKGF
ncbi:MAG: hypothetical protein M0036_23605 [Desulfobacteraceae bacterium]|nr:hypothetical protein [Desulfobacteraceae bacterium]